mmetsp:Transcript_13172/g.20505  ORF Transcript_13172/g.20505 Transcript_13172/m.20505 type:complete len:112 (+) Transcript_13172:5641-5976(+)
MEVYMDQFRIKGKRLENIDSIVGQKLYIGVSSSGTNLPKKNGGLSRMINNMTMNFKDNTGQFKPLKHAFAAILDHESTFELSVRYLPSKKMDFLDKYVLQNSSYGTHITSL